MQTQPASLQDFAIGACSIPVILADGLTLPYEQLFDWTDAVIRISIIVLVNITHANELLEYLPKDRATILAMRHRVCDINDMWMSTPAAHARAEHLIMASLLRMKQLTLYFNKN